MASRHTVEGKTAVGPIFTQHANERRLVFRDALPAYDIHAIAKGGKRMGVVRQFGRNGSLAAVQFKRYGRRHAGEHGIKLSAHAFVEKRLRI